MDCEHPTLFQTQLSMNWSPLWEAMSSLMFLDLPGCLGIYKTTERIRAHFSGDKCPTKPLREKRMRLLTGLLYTDAQQCSKHVGPTHVKTINWICKICALGCFGTMQHGQYNLFSLGYLEINALLKKSHLTCTVQYIASLMLSTWLCFFFSVHFFFLLVPTEPMPKFDFIKHREQVLNPAHEFNMLLFNSLKCVDGDTTVETYAMWSYVNGSE